MNVATFLDKIGEELARRGTSAREISMLEFSEDGSHWSVRGFSGLHNDRYPHLEIILRHVRLRCLRDGTSVSQLRRISFLENEIHVELVDEVGLTSRIYVNPIEA